MSRLLRSACLFVAATATAQGPVSPTLLVDFNQRPAGESEGSDPVLVDEVGGVSWFRATTAATGLEIWRTDGTAAGTYVLEAPDSGSQQSYRSADALPNGTLLVVADAPATGTEVFAAAPGARALTLLADVVPGAGSSFPVGPVVVGNTGWFFAEDNSPGVEIWRTDGTPAGTVLDEDLQGTPFCRLYGAAGKLWLIDNRLGAGVLRVKDGAGVATRALLPFPDLVAYEVVGEVSGRAVFYGESVASGIGRELWVSDGTVAGTQPLADIVPGAAPTLVEAFGSANGRFWFAAIRNVTGAELWVSDGTPANTRMVRDLGPGRTYGVTLDPSLAVPFGGGLVFYGNDGVSGFEPWFTDGTAAGTRLIRDLAPGRDDALMRGLTVHAGAVWFGAYDPTSGVELWRTDGTAAGTVQVADVVPGTVGSEARPIASTRNGLLFAADDGVVGDEPWIVDAATQQVRVLRNLAEDPVNEESTFGRPVVHDDFAFLTVGRGGFEKLPWVTDGTAAGTRPLALGGVPSQLGHSEPLGALSRGVLFTRSDPVNQYELRITDGTAPGAPLLGVFQFPLSVSSLTGSDPGWPVLDDRAYFYVSSANQQAIWETDGTAAGTGPVPGLQGAASFPPVAAHAGRLFGRGFDATRGLELWVSDRTVGGTGPVADLNPGPEGSFPSWFVDFRGGVFFAAQTAMSGHEPWISDGTAAGTVMLADIVPGAGGSLPRFPERLDDQLLFVALRGAGNEELWITDGTQGGTRRLASFVWNGPDRIVGKPHASGSLAFFQVERPDVGLVDLWVTDGSVSGTRRLVRSARDGLRLDRFRAMDALTDNGAVSFSAWSPQYGDELWVSDGTVAGTRPFADARPGAAGSVAVAAFRVGGQALFFASDGRTGRELHAAPLAALELPVAEPIGRGCGAEARVLRGAPRVGGAAVDLEFAASAPGARALGLVAGVDVRFGVPRPGCEVHVVQPVAVGGGTTDPQGRYRLSIAVPNVPALVGARLYLQAALVRPNGPLFGGLEATEAVELQIGR